MSTDFKRLGSQGPAVFPIALGCAAMSGTYGQSRDDAESIATIHEAIERGVNVLDTADFYGSGHNELLIGKALQGRRDKVLLSVKFGGLRSPDGGWVGLDARPVAVKNFLAYTLNRLGVDHVDVYRPARLDRQVPIEDTIGAISDLVRAGYVRQIGLSEVGPETIRRAHTVHPICDLQIEYSLMSRNAEKEIFPLLKELGIAVTAYGVLSHGLLGGTSFASRQGRSPRQLAAVQRGEPRTQPKARRGARQDRAGKTRDELAARDRLGAGPRLEHHPDHRLAQSHAAARSVGRARNQALRRRPGAHRAGRTGRSCSGHSLPRGADEDAG